MHLDKLVTVRQLVSTIIYVWRPQHFRTIRRVGQNSAAADMRHGKAGVFTPGCAACAAQQMKCAKRIHLLSSNAARQLFELRKIVPVQLHLAGHRSAHWGNISECILDKSRTRHC